MPTVRAAAVCAVLLLTTAAKDSDPVRGFTVVNDSTAAVNQLFVQPAEKKRSVGGKVRGLLKRESATDRDRLGLQSLRRGGSIALSLSGVGCRYDLTAVLEDGRTYRSGQYDICANDRWSVTTGTLD